MDFRSYLFKNAQLINEILESYYKIWQTQGALLDPSLTHLINTCIEANKGGKRLRGVLVLLGYHLAGRKTYKEIIKAAAAFEVFQTAVLNHDDIVDKSDLRRGRPTIYKFLGGDHYGLSQALNLGDIGYFQAIEMILSSKFPDHLKNKALHSFIISMTETGLGQAMDIEYSQKIKQYSEKVALTIFKLKTAKYTLTGPLHLGAILGGAGPKLLNQLEIFGDNLGIAFQIQDDILGIFGDEQKLGKSVTSDIEEGKNTLLIVEALKKANSAQKEILVKTYGRGKISQKELELIRIIFQETGALDYSQKKARALVKKAKTVIEDMKVKQQHKSLLTEMADFLVERQT